MPNSFRRKATTVILIAVVIRIAFVFAVDKGMVKVDLNPDYLDYLSFANNLATGVGFAHALNESEPFSRPVEFSAWRPPLYPAFLAIAFQFSRDFVFLRLLQVVLAALSLFFFLRVGFILFGELPALIAGLIFALYPPLIMYCVDLGTESMFLFLLTAVLFSFYAAGGKISYLRIFSLGALVGLTALCRPAGLMLAPALVLAIWLSSDWKYAAWRIIVFMFALAMIVLPWTYRNYRLFHKVVLITTNGGATFWNGAYLRMEPGASLADIGFPHRLGPLPHSEQQALEGLPEPEQERQFYRRGMAILGRSPRRLGVMAWRNFQAMYALFPSAQYHSLSNRMLYSISYIPVLISGVSGFWFLRRRWRELSLLWGWMLSSTTLCCLYLAVIRYRVPSIDPILILGSGVCLASLLEWNDHRGSVDEAASGRAQRSNRSTLSLTECED